MDDVIKLVKDDMAQANRSPDVNPRFSSTILERELTNRKLKYSSFSALVLSLLHTLA